jgi:hypothetical protein
VTHEPVRHGESGQKAAVGWSGHDCTVAHAAARGSSRSPCFPRSQTRDLGHPWSC